MKFYSIFKSPQEFVPINCVDNQIKERVILDNDNGNLFLVSIQPVLFASWVNMSFNNSIVRIKIMLDEVLIADLKCKPISRLCTDETNLFVFEPLSLDLPQLNFLQRTIKTYRIYRKSKQSKFNLTKRDIQLIAAAYFIPRKVYIVVVKGKDYLNIFPMDLHLESPISNCYSFALQVSNKACDILKETRQILVGEIPATQLKIVYSLGKNHGKVNLHKIILPFSFTESEFLKLPVPEFCIGYKEITITSFKSTGSHVLFIGKKVSEQKVDKNLLQPYHIHSFHNEYLKKIDPSRIT